jgi:hypothetical protein
MPESLMRDVGENKSNNAQSDQRECIVLNLGLHCQHSNIRKNALNLARHATFRPDQPAFPACREIRERGRRRLETVSGTRSDVHLRP